MTNFRYLCFILICFFTQNVIAGGIKVMTQNQYVGTDLSPLFVAATTDPGEFNDALIGVLEQIAKTKTAERINALAALIAKRGPHLVGLQEVYAFECENLTIAIDACGDPSISGAFVDHLVETLDALNPDPYNPKYVEVARVDNLKLPPDGFQLPGIPPGIPLDMNNDVIPDAFLTVVDRDVILARSDVSASRVLFDACTKPSADGCNYSAALKVSTQLVDFGDFTFNRGYVAVDATVKGKEYRFVNTHLEPSTFAQLQALQAQELIDTLASDSSSLEDKSLIVVGDMNSSPQDQSGMSPYEKFVENGYIDAWTLRPGNAKGFTCCQQPDLSNRKSELYERIDMIFSLDALKKVKRARVLGDEVSSKTPPPGRGLWPSDHGSVSMGLKFY